MARATSGLGQFRGKVGSVVFRVSQGKQIASAYQPAVRNPKSNLQTAQRNKMYLASQLSKLVPREDIIGLAPTASVRDRRNMFIKNIIDNTTSTLIDGVFTSAINVNNLSFSNNQLLNGVSGSSSGDGNITITFDKNVISEDMFNRMAIKLIQIDIANNITSLYKSAWLNLGTYDTTTENSFEVDVPITLNQGLLTYVFLVPVEVNDGVRYSSEKKTLIQGTGDSSDEIVVKGVYAINNAVLKWYRTISLGSFSSGAVPPIVVPPTGSGDEVFNPEAPDFPNLG